MLDEAADQKQLHELIDRDPIGAARFCRDLIKADDAGIHVQRRRRLAEAYLIAKRLKADYGLWQQFIADPFFDKDERIRKQDDTRFVFIVTRAVLIYLFSVLKTNNSMRNRVWRYARVIDHYDEKGVPPEEMVEHIKADGGIEKISAGVGKDYLLEDEHHDWELEMRSRAEPDEAEMRRRAVIDDCMTEDAPEEEDLPEEHDEEEPKLEPAAYIVAGDDVSRYLTAMKNGAEVYLIATKSGVDDEGRIILRVSEINEHSPERSEYKKAMQEWEQHEKDEGYM